VVCRQDCGDFVQQLLKSGLEALKKEDFWRAADCWCQAWKVGKNPLVANLVDGAIEKVTLDKSVLAAQFTDIPALIQGSLLDQERVLAKLVPKLAWKSTVMLYFSKLVPHPRISARLITLLGDHARCTRSTLESYERLIGLLGENGDVRQLGELEHLIRHYLAWVPNKPGHELLQSLKKLHSKLLKVVPVELTPEEAMLVFEAGQLLGVLNRDKERRQRREAGFLEERLLQAVYSHPEEDGPRLVLADFYLEQGKPAGAFIQSDMQPEKQYVYDLRLKTATDIRERMGSIGPALLWCVFERGFPAHVVLKTTEDLGLTTTEPGWQTVGSVAMQEWNMNPRERVRLLRLLESPCLQNVQCMEEIPADVLAGLAESGRTVRSVRVGGQVSGKVLEKLKVERLGLMAFQKKPEDFPFLRELPLKEVRLYIRSSMLYTEEIRQYLEQLEHIPVLSFLDGLDPGQREGWEGFKMRFVREQGGYGLEILQRPSLWDNRRALLSRLGQIPEGMLRWVRYRYEWTQLFSRTEMMTQLSEVDIGEVRRILIKGRHPVGDLDR
jgi:uncharacterized protein (TIGR02996 family)